MQTKLTERFSTNNIYYKRNVTIHDARYADFQKYGPQGAMLHSVGCPQPKASVFANVWNSAESGVAVHAVIQHDFTGFQCLPWNFRGIHAGGSGNNTHIGIEMTEPDCIEYTGGENFICHDLKKAQAHATGCYNTAVDLFAGLAIQFGWDPMTDIISHKEGRKKGVASNHGDPEHLWRQLKLPYTMDTFRKDVKALIDKETAPLYRVRKSWSDKGSQIGAFRDLDNAIKACKDGYTVYDEDGNSVYSTVEKITIDYAANFTESKAGTYKVSTKGGTLRLRSGASTDHPVLEDMPNGSKVQNYGFHTKDWLYVISASGKRGFCHISYLKKI